MNSVVLVGRLTKDVDFGFLPNTQTGKAVFTLAVDGIKKDDTDFIRVTVFGKQAENCDRYIGKGSQVAINGRIHTGSYKDREGKTVYTTDVIAERVEFLSRPTENKPMQTEQENSSFEVEPEETGTFNHLKDDIPF